MKGVSIKAVIISRIGYRPIVERPVGTSGQDVANLMKELYDEYHPGSALTLVRVTPEGNIVADSVPELLRKLKMIE